VDITGSLELKFGLELSLGLGLGLELESTSTSAFYVWLHFRILISLSHFRHNRGNGYVPCYTT